jgi:hypothetical protein
VRWQWELLILLGIDIHDCGNSLSFVGVCMICFTSLSFSHVDVIPNFVNNLVFFFGVFLETPSTTLSTPVQYVKDRSICHLYATLYVTFSPILHVLRRCP